jgi:hypothetical protein
MWTVLKMKLMHVPSVCRLLELHRVPLAVGRIVDLEKDILPVATERLRNTFFTNGNPNSVIWIFISYTVTLWFK